ncbi:RDD family protein [Siculibacillus lacustris]|uniref:RDD family protein n=1 Tax=Siculibacillus lacustris TaxID=1549641 RepID=A0A4Q9VUK4_9HYPH|nr:RDD family protein [Siculibacillus lacustris]TBW39736.1 RDD family protein [Siculibacillus lacustris]
MSQPTQQIVIRWVFDPVLEPDLFEGLLSRRCFAFLFDLIAVSLLWLVAAFVVFFLGLATFGLAWLVYPALWPVIGLLYTVSGLSGPSSATAGMRAMGLSMRTLDGARPDALRALFHVVIFYALSFGLTPLVHLIGLFNVRRQLLQDMIVGVVVLDGRVLAMTGR